MNLKTVRTGLAATVVTALLAVVGPATAVFADPPQHGAGSSATHSAGPRPVHGTKGHGGGSSNLSYHGGYAGGGVEAVQEKIYLVYWGSQWNNNDPSGEAALQQKFFNGVGGSSWNNSVTQYCEGVPAGTIFCNGLGTTAANGVGALQGVWYDNATAAPSTPTQSQLASEAISAATHFLNTNQTSNLNVQYAIETATGNSASGFGTQYCAWHSSTSSAYGQIAYTNGPYITDGGAACGANFNNLGPNAGITIVDGHEFAESETDPFPNTGWLDGRGAENGDKCAWISSGQGASANVGFSTGTFPVQSLWSNAFNSGAGGCVLSYP
jgi:serine protease